MADPITGAAAAQEQGTEPVRTPVRVDGRCDACGEQVTDVRAHPCLTLATPPAPARAGDAADREAVDVLTDAQLAEIEARVNAASADAWHDFSEDYTEHGGPERMARDARVMFERGGGLLSGVILGRTQDEALAAAREAGPDVDAGTQIVCLTGNGPRATANAAFIAHARTDIPALLATLRAQADRVAALEQEAKEARTGWRMAALRGEEWVREIAELREKLATNARLTVEAINAADAARAAAERSEAWERFHELPVSLVTRYGPDGVRYTFSGAINDYATRGEAVEAACAAYAWPTPALSASRAATEDPASPVGGDDHA